MRHIPLIGRLFGPRPGRRARVLLVSGTGPADRPRRAIATTDGGVAVDVDTPLRFVDDIGPAEWIRERLHPFAQDVGSVIPEGFAAYARILHPAWRRGEPVTWREIAAANGRAIHPQVQFGHIAGVWRRSPDPRLWDAPPWDGTLPIALAGALVELLRPLTRTPDRCWMAVWTSDVPDAALALPRLVVPGRDYALASGPIDDVTRDWLGYRSPSIWWPDDRAWAVATEVDLDSSYVGGTRECVDAILAHPGLEAVRADIADPITWDSDSVNPSPGPPH